MTKKLTPEEAFEHIKVLWPETEWIENNFGWAAFRKANNGETLLVAGGSNQLNWPKGVTRWPPQEEWRDAVWPDDWGKEARFRDYHRDRWAQCILCGYTEHRAGPWIDADGYLWKFCQVRSEDNK